MYLTFIAGQSIKARGNFAVFVGAFTVYRPERACRRRSTMRIGLSAMGGAGMRRPADARLGVRLQTQLGTGAESRRSGRRFSSLWPRRPARISAVELEGPMRKVNGMNADSV